MDLERINELLPRHHRRFLRRALERLLAVVGLVVCSPILILLIFVVRLGSRGPAILRQERIGLNGKPFTMYKLRSMYENAESNSGAVWASDNDPRVTPVGRFLRKLHLDELPQLFNILRGEMSFVG
ncbi:MAG TPA: sugar transferase, partial [Lacipirellulaceae bacterium]|nr:sugar transferase [Lacipirellulaceae bacterium]